MDGMNGLSLCWHWFVEAQEKRFMLRVPVNEQLLDDPRWTLKCVQ